MLKANYSLWSFKRVCDHLPIVLDTFTEAHTHTFLVGVNPKRRFDQKNTHGLLWSVSLMFLSLKYFC